MAGAAPRSDGPRESNTDLAIPDAETLGRLISPDSPRHRSVQQLHALLVACRPGQSPAERVEAFEKLARWLQLGRGVVKPAHTEPGDTPQVQRVRLFLEAMRMSPPLGRRVAFTLSRVFDDSIGGTFFSRLGLPTDRGFLAETIDRFSRRYLPEPRDDRDLLQFVARLFPTKGSLRVLSAMPPELARDVTLTLGNANPDVDPWAALREHVIDASALLSTRISALGLSDVLRARSPRVALSQSPFFKLPRAVDTLIDAVRRKGDALAAAAECRDIIRECRHVSEIVVENLEQYGVSIDVVYRIELLGKSLGRLSALILELEPCSDLEKASAAKALLVELVGLRLRDRQIADIIRGNLHLLARKIIERAGHSGEHYITTTTGEYVKMLLSAGGGGVLTVGTMAIKFVILWEHFAPFVEGVLAGSNYAASFIAMQLFGFTLATKQPSMTAAALAGTLRETAGHPDLSALVAMIARITRSQLAAAIGNIGFLIPSAVAFDLLWRARHGRSFLDETTAHYVFHSLHPLHGTVFFGVLTGVVLWMSSIAAGWIENWAVYRRLPEAIADHRFGRFVGRGTMAWFSRFFLRNISGFGGNAALGFMLAMTPVVGKFVGLPIEVPHMTLSTGALTLSAVALGSEVLQTVDFWSAVLGILIIGALNFGVSFVLALLVALRARQVNRSDRLRLLLSVVATFMRSPLQFFVPPRQPTTLRVHGPVSVPPPALR